MDLMNPIMLAFLTGLSTALLPYALAFAAGAMIYVVIEELIPECQRSGHADAAVLAAILRFHAHDRARPRTRVD